MTAVLASLLAVALVVYGSVGLILDQRADAARSRRRDHSKFMAPYRSGRGS